MGADNWALNQLKLCLDFNRINYKIINDDTISICQLYSEYVKIKIKLKQDCLTEYNLEITYPTGSKESVTAENPLYIISWCMRKIGKFLW